MGHRQYWGQLAAAQAMPLLVVPMEPNVHTCVDIARVSRKCGNPGDNLGETAGCRNFLSYQEVPAAFCLTQTISCDTTLPGYCFSRRTYWISPSPMILNKSFFDILPSENKARVFFRGMLCTRKYGVCYNFH